MGIKPRDEGRQARGTGSTGHSPVEKRHSAPASRSRCGVWTAVCFMNPKSVHAWSSETISTIFGGRPGFGGRPEAASSGTAAICPVKTTQKKQAKTTRIDMNLPISDASDHRKIPNREKPPIATTGKDLRRHRGEALMPERFMCRFAEPRPVDFSGFSAALKKGVSPTEKSISLFCPIFREPNSKLPYNSSTRTHRRRLTCRGRRGIICLGETRGWSVLGPP